MELSHLQPFVRENLDILFVGLNPATGSNRNGHYFSVNSAFWNQLRVSGLILQEVPKSSADDLVFGSTEVNYNGWSYGITDLVTAVAESNSRKVAVTTEDCQNLINEIVRLKPRTVVLLHSRVRRSLAKFLDKSESCDGRNGKWLFGRTGTEFFVIPFPHGNAICSGYKICLYCQLRAYLDSIFRE